MPIRPKKKAQPQASKQASEQQRADQVAARRRQEMATRSTLSRLRNRKSDLK